MKPVDIPRVEFHRETLENGLQVVVHRSSRVPLVHVSVHYRVGSSYEESGRSGLAHLFEHMMFQGSENVAKNEHGRMIDQAGGRWNASTSKDRTNYYNTLPASHLNVALWLEADRMRALQITEENFENQRQTVIEEKKQSYDNRPYGLSYLRFDELAYQNWAYAHSIIGSVSDLQQLSLESARSFHETYYGPGNASLVISGDIVEDEALKRVRQFFRAIPDRTCASQPDLSAPKQLSERWEEVADPLAPLPAVSIGYHMDRLGSKEYYAFLVLGLILAQGDSSRFYRDLVYERNWITGLFAGPNQYRGPGMFRIWFQIQRQIEAETVIEAVDAELNQVAQAGVTDEELEKAQRQVAYRFVSRLATVARIGEALNHYWVYFDDPELLNSEIKSYQSVTSGQIQEAAQRVFRRQNRTLILTQPGSES